MKRVSLATAMTVFWIVTLLISFWAGYELGFLRALSR